MVAAHISLLTILSKPVTAVKQPALEHMKLCNLMILICDRSGLFLMKEVDGLGMGRILRSVSRP